jgi:hypothetical protein
MMRGNARFRVVLTTGQYIAATPLKRHYQETRLMPPTLESNLLDALDKLAGGLHPGFRPVHAKGVMYSGTFIPSTD